MNLILCKIRKSITTYHETHEKDQAKPFRTCLKLYVRSLSLWTLYANHEIGFQPRLIIDGTTILNIWFWSLILFTKGRGPELLGRVRWPVISFSLEIWVNCNKQALHRRVLSIAVFCTAYICPCNIAWCQSLLVFFSLYLGTRVKGVVFAGNWKFFSPSPL